MAKSDLKKRQKQTLNDSSPSKWAIGRVTGLRLDDDNIWNYTIVFDYPLGYCDELTESELAGEHELACVS